MDKNQTFIPGLLPQTEPLKPAWWFAFQGDKLLMQAGDPFSIPRLLDFAELRLPTVNQHYLGHFAGRACYAVQVATAAAPPAGMTFQGLRQVYDHIEEDLFWVASRAVQIVDWDSTHRFCNRCGTPLVKRTTERAKECPQCGLLLFPRLSPAIIVLIERGRELLLARARRFPPGRYSVIAGFVEPGEKLEEAVEREVREEVGLTIKDIRYFGSQPWPFPHSLMIGFTATYAGGEISLNDGEIEKAGWFTAENLPALPGKISIARKLIDAFLEKQTCLSEAAFVTLDGPGKMQRPTGAPDSKARLFEPTAKRPGRPTTFCYDEHS